MPDIDYPLTGVNLAFRYRAARSAVLHPILDRPIAGEESIIAAMTAVRKRWRHLLVCLRDAKFRRFEVDEADKSPLAVKRRMALQYARNCPPFGVVTDKKALGMHCCRLSRVCPFCYGRDVAKNFEAMEAGLWPDKDNTDARDDLALVETQAVSRYRPKEGNAWTDAVKASFLTEAVEAVEARRKQEVKVLAPVAALVAFRMELGEAEWTPVRCGLFLLPKEIAEAQAAKIEPAKPPATKTVTVHPGPVTKTLLTQALGRTMRFPATMFKADAGDVVRYLSTFEKVRMSSRSGLFRPNKRRT